VVIKFTYFRIKNNIAIADVKFYDYCAPVQLIEDFDKFCSFRQKFDQLHATTSLMPPQGSNNFTLQTPRAD